MSGHSKWASIKHKKAIVDSRRGKLFTKLARAITTAARDGGGELEGNPSLQLAVQKARDASMPKDNIERAIAKGTGAGADAAAIEDVMYEGYGPGGVALLIEASISAGSARNAARNHGTASRVIVKTATPAPARGTYTARNRAAMDAAAPSPRLRSPIDLPLRMAASVTAPQTAPTTTPGATYATVPPATRAPAAPTTAPAMENRSRLLTRTGTPTGPHYGAAMRLLGRPRR